jgi:hypothetical protein
LCIWYHSTGRGLLSESLRSNLVSRDASAATKIGFQGNQNLRAEQ